MLIIKGFTVTCDNCGVQTRVFNDDVDVEIINSTTLPKGTVRTGETLRDNDNIIIRAGYSCDILFTCNCCKNLAEDSSLVEPNE